MTVLAQELSLSSIHPPLLWEPVQGQETLAFVAGKKAGGMSQTAIDNLVFEAQQILGRCAPPSAAAADATGLVVGYVQSGKTMSFTTLAALARDNGFGMVILIAGTLNNLRTQTRERIRADLGTDKGTSRAWVVVDNPKPGAADVLVSHLRRWLNPSMPPSKRRTIIAVVLKSPGRLKNLRDCLQGLNMAKVPTLVIDDEADQAGLNNLAAKNLLTGESRKTPSYREVIALKHALPHHTYVQYTATPQAPLLVGLDDELSPQFAELLLPGSAYVGGKTLFAVAAGYAQAIPAADAGATMLTHKGPPPSLLNALLVFLLGACAVEESGGIDVRTMMVHPSQQTALHGDYLTWVSEALEEWRAMAVVPELVPQLEKLFEKPYVDLKKTVGNDMPGLRKLLEHLPSVLHTTSWREVNSTGAGAGAIDWSASEYWVLIGGAKLDRGYTVEGLSVTYMPRPLGVGNADTMQQRARFYGYKKGYLGYCRVYLLQDVLDAFVNYVEHEEAIHESLRTTRGQPLREWTRQFVLDDAMKPTRAGVIGLPLNELKAEGWLSPRCAYKTSNDTTSNRVVMEAFVALLGGLGSARPANEVDSKRYVDRRKATKNALFEGVDLAMVIDDFLTKLRFADIDDQVQWAGVVKILKRLQRSGETLIDVFAIGGLQPQERSKRRGGINEVFSGQSPDRITDRSLLNYGGDRSFHSAVHISLHLRFFDLKDDKSSAITEKNVPWYAVHVPEALAARLLFQGTDT